jgi:isocitrate/isopropylmalate dehydrogenase
MQALGRVLTEGRVRTRDLGGTASTLEFADAVAREMAEGRFQVSESEL